MESKKEVIMDDVVLQLDTAYKALIWFGEEYLDTGDVNDNLKQDCDGDLVRAIPAYQWASAKLLFLTISDLLGNSLDAIKALNGTATEYFNDVLQIMEEENRKYFKK